jgi:hypothetical protein
LSTNDAEEFTLFPFDSGYYSFADEGIRRNFQAWKITKAIDWHSYSQSVMHNRDFVGAFTDVSDSDLVNELQGRKDIGDGPVLQNDTNS